MIILLSCEKNQIEIPPIEISEDLISEWTETSNAGPRIDVNSSLIINSNSTFTYNVSFYEMTPETDNSTSVLFQGCTYKIVGDLLNISYITYPADATVETIKEFLKLE